jgi:asparagine synthase (glutamine-hydrolysing)
VAVLGKKGQNVAATAVTMLQVCGEKGADGYGLASSEASLTAESVTDLAKVKLNSPIIVGYASSKILKQDRLPPLKLKDSALVFSGRDYAHAGEDAGESFARQFQTGREQAAAAFIRKCESDFLFVIAEPEGLVAGRDTIGLRPLYYGENVSFAALASERKALWKIGIDHVESFPPGCVGYASKQGFSFVPVKRLEYLKPPQMTMETAAKKLQAMLELSVRERVAELKEVAIAFSGGLDSSIIALLAKKSRGNVHLVHVALENQHETEHAFRAAEELKLPLCSQTYTEKDVQQVVPSVLEAIEEPDPVKLSIAIPIFWAAKKTAEMNCRIMLAGQGADELFGGYKRYVDDYLRFGGEKTRETMFKDVAGMHEDNLERDWKACNANDVELRLPFAARKIVEFALSLPLEVKLEPEKNTLRKLVLRRVAKNLGLPSFIADKPKKAVQYTTGINKALGKLAEQQDLSVREYVGKSFQKTFAKVIPHE